MTIAPAPSETTQHTDQPQQRPFEQVLDRLTSLGPALSDSVPGFEALFVVGAPAALGALPLVIAGDRLIAGSDLPLVLIAGGAIPKPTLHCLAAGMGLRAGVRVRLHCFQRNWLAAQVRKQREGFELFAARHLLAGSDECLRDLAVDWRDRPAPEAAENLLVSGLDLLVRSWPVAPMLAKAKQSVPAEATTVAIALAEVCRLIGDALGLLRGTFACEPSRQSQALQAAAADAGERGLWAWAYGATPEALPIPSSHEVWDAILGLFRKALGQVVETRTGIEYADAHDLIDHVRSCRRNWWSRLRRTLVDRRRGGGREHAHLQLVLALARRADGGEDKSLIALAAALLPRLGGPILANPDWPRLRREALLL
jgi:hypothetical protein